MFIALIVVSLPIISRLSNKGGDTFCPVVAILRVPKSWPGFIFNVSDNVRNEVSMLLALKCYNSIKLYIKDGSEYNNYDSQIKILIQY